LIARRLAQAEVWCAAAVSLVAVVIIPLYLGLARAPAPSFIGYAAVAGIGLAIGDWLDSGHSFIEDPVGVLVDASVWSLATAIFGGIAFLLAHWI
jgi:hypothetical protein